MLTQKMFKFKPSKMARNAFKTNMVWLNLYQTISNKKRHHKKKEKKKYNNNNSVNLQLCSIKEVLLHVELHCVNKAVDARKTKKKNRSSFKKNIK